MAITTIQGSSGRDLTTLLGTSLYDTIRINNNNLYWIREKEMMLLADESIEAITIDAGGDNDILAFESEAIDSTFAAKDDNVFIRDYSGLYIWHWSRYSNHNQ